MKVTSTVRVKVEPDGSCVVAHLGLHALGSFADRMGLADVLSSRLRGLASRAALHDRGKLVVQVTLMFAGGVESCADIERLRCEEDLFGDVASNSMVHRALHEITPELRSELAEAVFEVRGKIWERSAQTKGAGPVYIDIDASLVEIHSVNKQQTATTYKGGFGFHPMFCFADATGEALSSLLRPGSAGSNTVADHGLVLEAPLPSCGSPCEPDTTKGTIEAS